MRKIKNSELGRKSVEEFKNTEKKELIVVLDNIRSLNNIGSFFRTSDAFLVKEILLCGITACPPHRDIQKTALGATESVAWQYFKTTMDAVNYLKELSYNIYAVEQIEGSISLEDFDPNKNENKATALVFGNEVKGVSEYILPQITGAIEIPQYGTKHSLNVSISGGIAIWEVFKRLKE